MSQLFTGEHNVLIMRGVTKHGLRRTVRFWAERGLIHCEDSLDNSYESMSVRSFLHRAKGLNDMLAKSAINDDTGADADLKAEIQRNVEQMTDIAYQAQLQGMPEDASARRAATRARAKTFYTGTTGNAIM